MTTHPHTDQQSVTLWTLTAGHRARYLGAMAAMAVANLFLFGPPLIGKYAIDHINGVAPTGVLAAITEFATTLGDNGDLLFLVLCGLLTLLLTAVGGFFHYLRGVHTSLAAEGITRRTRERLYSHIAHLTADWHDKAEVGDLVQRCSSDVETLRVFLASDIVEIGRATLLLVTVAPILFALDATLALVSLSLMPLVFVFALIFFRRIKTVFQAADEAEAEMTATLQENLTGIRVVRAFARQQFEIEKFGARNARFRDLNHRLMRIMGVYWASQDFLCFSQIGLVLGFGAYGIATGSVSAGTVFAFMTYVAVVIWPLRQMARVLSDSGKAVVSLGRVNEVLGAQPEAAGHVPDVARASGRIEFQNVTFGYLPERDVLRNVSFTIAPGETLAIVGPPGCGKTTIVRLLLRLYDYTQGSIRLEGAELATLDRQYVRAQFGVVLQEPFLYSRTIGENLGVGRRNADHNHLIEATRAAAVHDAIAAFPAGYATMVGERGVTLSGGQRQRLALARALLRDPAILVLDDALSAVDTDTERRILDALSGRRGRATTIVIAHRLTSIRRADRILVLDAGRLVELGTHAELVRANGPYRRLCEIQGALEASIDNDLREPVAAPAGN